MSITRSTLTLFGTRQLGVAIGFVAIVVFAREIGVAALGSFFLFQSLLDVLTLATDVGLKSAVEKRISEGRPADEAFGTGIALKGGLLAVGATVVIALREPLAGFVGADLAWPLVAVAILRESGRLTTYVLRGELRVGHSGTVELLRKATYGVVGVALAVNGFGVRAPVYGLLVGYAVMTAVGLARVDTGIARPSASMARSLLDYSRYMFVAQAGGVGYSWIDVLVLGTFLSPAAVGVYEVAWKVAAVATMFSDSLATAAFPQLSEYSGQGALDRIERLFPRLVTPSLAVAVPAFFGTLVLAREILSIVFGAAYVGAALVLVVLMADSITASVYKSVGRTLRALDRPDLDARAIVVQLVLSAGFNVALVPLYGILGAAIATSLAALLGRALALRSLTRLMTVRVQTRAVAWCVVAGAGMAVVVRVARESLGVERAVELGAVIGLGVAVYASLVMAAPTTRTLVTEAFTTLFAASDGES